MAKLGDLIVNVGANTTGLNKALGDVKKGASNTFGNISKLGVGLSASITAPFVAMATAGVAGFREQEKAIAQVEAGLKSTGNAVGFTSEKLQAMAADLQSNTLFGDEVILKDATAQLLTFTNITDENFARTQEAALDLATRLDGDLKGASIQLGKALNDPVANLSALSRSGIQFSEDQKAVIKSMAETGDLAGAQTIILDELNKQYGGSAKAAAEADGGFTQLANTFGDIQEEIGSIIVTALRPLLKFLKNLFERFQDLSGPVKTLIVGFGAVAAAVGPILLLLPQLATVAGIVGPAIGAAFTAMTGPIGLTVLAIAAVVTAIFYFWDDVKGPLTKIINTFITLYNENEGLRVAIGVLKQTFVSAFKIIKQNIKNAADAFGVLFTAIKTAFTDGFGAAADVLKKGFTEIVDNSINTGKEVYDGFVNAVDDAKTKEPLELVTEDDLDAAKDRITNLFDFTAGGGASAATVPVVVVPELDTDLLLEEFEEAEEIDIPLDFDPEPFLAKIEAMKGKLKDFKESVAEAFEGAAEAVAMSVGSMIGSMAAGTAAPGDFGNQILGVFANLATQLGELAIGYGIAIKGIKEALQTLNPVLAVVAGVALIALGQGLKGAIAKRTEAAGMPALAQGGLAYGPTTALVGDNRNASIDPEVIAPLSKLKDMMGGNVVEVVGRIKGDDIFLSNARNSINRNRYS